MKDIVKTYQRLYHRLQSRLRNMDKAGLQNTRQYKYLKTFKSSRNYTAQAQLYKSRELSKALKQEQYTTRGLRKARQAEVERAVSKGYRATQVDLINDTWAYLNATSQKEIYYQFVVGFWQSEDSSNVHTVDEAVDALAQYRAQELRSPTVPAQANFRRLDLY